MLLQDYQGQTVTGWLMAEKLDGWRVIWNGSDFITREGIVLESPAWFRDGMPDYSIDGELFAGRGNFNSIQGLIRDGWHGLTFQAFDLPDMLAPFRRRYQLLKSLLLPAHVGIVSCIRCRDTQHLVEFADQIVMDGGEGAVVRDPKAMYQQCRTESILRWVPQDPRLNRRKSA